MNTERLPQDERPVVVVADDEVHLVELLELILERFEVRVVKAYDGEQALRAVHQHRPVLVITDLMMPRLNGTELCRRIKGNPETAHIPVIALSAISPGDRPDSGADVHLEKPFDMDRVEEWVQWALESHAQ